MPGYTIVGSDGKEYGPISADELRRWLAEGRVDAQTMVRAEGVTNLVPLSQIPGFENAPGNAARFAPQTISALPPPLKSKMSALAVTSLVLGILGLFTCGGTALFGLILGIIALVKVGNSRGELRGRGVALAGLIVSVVFLLMVPVFAALLLPALAGAHDRARQIVCMSNEKQLASALMVYSQNNTNHYPPAATWGDALKPFVGGADVVFHCPAVDGTGHFDYAFNARLDGMETSKVNPQTVVIFESDSGWNAHGGPEIASTARHRNASIVAFADGHVERVKEDRFNSLRWDP